MKQVLRQLMGIHHASVLLLRTTGNYARPLVTCNAKIFESVRKFSSTQGDVKESDSTVVKKEEASEPQLDQIPGKLEPEIEARIEHFKQKRQQRKDLLSMDEEELAPYAIGMKQKSYLERVEGPYAKAGISRFLEQDRDEKYNMTDQIAFMQQDLDFRIPAIKRYFAKVNEEWEIKLQKYNAQRNAVLGDDLAAAHFIVFRKGRVKFVGQDNWVDKYRTDQEQEENELDLPDMQFDLCVLPTAYDPNYLVEAIDATNIPLRYEGLDNLANLPYCKFLKLENCTHLEAWCMDKLAYMFAERLEFLDISGCTGLTEGALCSLVRFRKLKTLVMRNLPQVTNMAVICAILEDSNPDLKIFGVDYEQRLNEIKTENERLEKQAKEIEDNTITVETVHGPDHVLDSK